MRAQTRAALAAGLSHPLSKVHHSIGTCNPGTTLSPPDAARRQWSNTIRPGLGEPLPRMSFVNSS